MSYKEVHETITWVDFTPSGSPRPLLIKLESGEVCIGFFLYVSGSGMYSGLEQWIVNGIPKRHKDIKYWAELPTGP